MTQVHQQRILTVDQGNTLVKVCMFVDGDLQMTSVFDTGDLEEAKRFCVEYPDAVVIFCSTCLDDERLEEIRRQTGWFVVDRTTPVPLEICYASPEKLGRDRVAAACGAAALFPGESVFVVDAGTALTLDVVTDGRYFNGGNISPGTHLRFESLAHSTAMLPEVDAEGDVPVFGYDTLTAIRSGVVRGVAYEILGSFLMAEHLFGCRRMVLTGGDSLLYEEQLEAMDVRGGDNEKRMIRVPDLMSRGLISIYKFNYEKNL